MACVGDDVGCVAGETRAISMVGGVATVTDERMWAEIVAATCAYRRAIDRSSRVITPKRPKANSIDSRVARLNTDATSEFRS